MQSLIKAGGNRVNTANSNMATSTLTTAIGQKITIRSNATTRVYTIILEDGEKFKTYPMTKDEFEEAYYNTAEDWRQYLNHSGGCYRVKK